ncbi:MAG: sulfotransferase [Acidobacteriota bacterium]
MPGKDFVTIVSGLPRSGTSLMMQMLAAGGIPLLTDGIRPPDEDNPRGYFEFEPVKSTKKDSSWLREASGKAVKMVYLLLRDLPSSHDYRVILMRRELHEVIASQRAMLRRLGRAGADVGDERLAAIFEEQMKSIAAWLGGQENCALLEVNYRDCIQSPMAAAHGIDEFLGGGLDVPKMAAAVDVSLYRRSRINAVLS